MTSSPDTPIFWEILNNSHKLIIPTTSFRPDYIVHQPEFRDDPVIEIEMVHIDGNGGLIREWNAGFDID